MSNLRTFTKEEVAEVIRLHNLWRNSDWDVDLSRGDLSNADLRHFDFGGEQLSSINFRGSDLSHCSFCGTDLSNALMKDTNLNGACCDSTDFSGAMLDNATVRMTDFTNANLSDVDLSGVDLATAKLWGTIGNGKEIKTLQTEKYFINFIAGRIQIGCKNHSVIKWDAFLDKEIDKMEHGALVWWKENKAMVMYMYKYFHPVTE